MYKCDSSNSKSVERDKYFTVAHLYKTIYSSNKSPLHYYVYKVNGKIYTSSDSTTILENFNEKLIYNFLLSYSKNNPKIHEIVWNYELHDFTSLEQNFSMIGSEDKLLKKNRGNNTNLDNISNDSDSVEIHQYYSVLKEYRKIQSD